MRRYTSTITQRGQVTLPAEIRRLLGVGVRDQVEFIVDDGEVRLRRPEFTLETVYGSVKPWWNPKEKDIDEVIREAKEEYRADRWERKRQRES